VPARVALLHDYESLWIQDAQPHSENATYWRQVMLFYGTLRSLGLDVDIRHPDHDLSSYDLIVAPAIQLMGKERADHLASYAGEAILVFGPRAAYRTLSGRVHEDGQPGPLRDLAGHALLNFDAMRPGLTVRAGGHEVVTWAEAYRPTSGTAMVTYDDGPLAGQAAVVRNGNAISVGAWSASLLTDVLTSACREVGIPHLSLPDGVRVSRRGASEIWMNFNESDVRLPDGRTLGPVSFQITTNR
jgi:beta-galactosidase